MIKKILLFVIAFSVVLLSSCTKEQKLGQIHAVYCARMVYDAAVNVYSGTLLEIDLYEDGGELMSDTYYVKVQVKEVFKGNFKEGEIVKDLSPEGFSEIGCDYFFMTGVDPQYGYHSHAYYDADNVYSGEILEIDLFEFKREYGPTYKVKVKVKDVYRGDYNTGDIVEEIIFARREEIRDDIIFMTSNDDPYSLQHRLEATNIVYGTSNNPYRMVKLLDNGEIEYPYFSFPGEYDNPYSRGITPPKNYDELIAQINTPISYDVKPFVPPFEVENN